MTSDMIDFIRTNCDKLGFEFAYFESALPVEFRKACPSLFNQATRLTSPRSPRHHLLRACVDCGFCKLGCCMFGIYMYRLVQVLYFAVPCDLFVGMLRITPMAKQQNGHSFSSLNIELGVGPNGTAYLQGPYGAFKWTKNATGIVGGINQATRNIYFLTMIHLIKSKLILNSFSIEVFDIT